MFLSLEQFLLFFPIVKISREDFIKRFVITYANHPSLDDLFAFRSVIKNENDSRYINKEQIIDYFYQIIIEQRHHFLSLFYYNYLEIPNPYDLKWNQPNILIKSKDRDTNPINDQQFNQNWIAYNQNPNSQRHLAQMRTEFIRLLEKPLDCLSLQRNDQSRKIIRNLNYLDILDLTVITNTCKSKVSFWQSLINAFNHLQLEDRFFAPSSIGLFLSRKSSGEMNFNNFFYLFQQYQPKASILNPYTINWILKNLFHGTKLLTPVLSWGAYLCAFMHSDWEEYVGIDVMPQVCQRCQFLFDYYQNILRPNLKKQSDITQIQRKHLKLFCQPSESLLDDNDFIKQYSEYFDAVLLCPPYFDMEIYPTGQQSISLYPDYQQWLVNYWEKTVKMSFLVLKKEQRFGFIVNDYESLGKKSYHLIEDLNLIVLKYFQLVGMYQLLNRVSPLRVNKKRRTEMLFIYEKRKTDLGEIDSMNDTQL